MGDLPSRIKWSKRPIRRFSLKDFFKLIKDIPKNLKDTENKTRMITSLFPFVDRALFASRDREEMEKIWDFLYDIKEQLDRIEKNLGAQKKIIDYKFIDSDEFHYLLKKTLEKVRLEYKEEKIKLFRNLILNSLRKDKPRINFHYYLNKIESLEVEHFKIIEWYHKNKYFEANVIGSEYDDKKANELGLISKYYPSLENDLQVLGFLSLVQVEAYQKHRYLLNKLGREFFEFIKYDEVA